MLIQGDTDQNFCQRTQTQDETLNAPKVPLRPGVVSDGVRFPALSKKGLGSTKDHTQPIIIFQAAHTQTSVSLVKDTVQSNWLRKYVWVHFKTAVVGIL